MPVSANRIRVVSFTAKLRDEKSPSEEKLPFGLLLFREIPSHSAYERIFIEFQPGIRNLAYAIVTDFPAFLVTN